MGDITAERTDTDVPIELTVDNFGGVPGLTAVVAIRDANTANSWLDFSDNTFKAAGWTTRQAALTEVSAALAPGQYRRILDVAAITNLPAGTRRLIAEFDVSGIITANDHATITLVNDLFTIADSVWTEVLAAHETTSGSAAEAIASNRNRIRIDFTASPPALVVFDQAGTAELYRADLTTINGAAVLAFFGVQHERAAPV